MNKISLVMITKNEEKNLAKSLDSVKDLVDEIVILDSVSTDSTIKIAEKYGAKIYSRKSALTVSLFISFHTIR